MRLMVIPPGCFNGRWFSVKVLFGFLHVGRLVDTILIEYGPVSVKYLLQYSNFFNSYDLRLLYQSPLLK